MAGILENKYGFRRPLDQGLRRRRHQAGQVLLEAGDAGLIDGVLVNGSAVLVDRVAGVLRQIQTGRLYNYAFAMILGLIVLMAVLVPTVGA